MKFPKTRGGNKTLCSERAGNRGKWKSEGVGEVYGIHTQTEILKLPKDLIFCGISISGSSSGFYYDDGFALTMNNLILATGRFGPDEFDYHAFNKNDPNAENNDEIREWSFNKIKGRDYDSTGEEGCSVATTDKDEEGNDQVDCNVPKTQTKGRFILNPTKKVSRLLSRHLGLKNKSSSDLKNKIKFELHVTGDDDEEIDCKHSGLTLDLEFEYFSKADFK